VDLFCTLGNSLAEECSIRRVCPLKFTKIAFIVLGPLTPRSFCSLLLCSAPVAGLPSPLLFCRARFPCDQRVDSAFFPVFGVPLRVSLSFFAAFIACRSYCLITNPPNFVRSFRCLPLFRWPCPRRNPLMVGRHEGGETVQRQSRSFLAVTFF